MDNLYNDYFKALQWFESQEKAREALQLGRNKRANVIARIPRTAYYRKVCISPKCQREFEGTIRGQYCNYAPNGSGSSCRVTVMRLKRKAYLYLFAQSLLFAVLIYVASLVLDGVVKEWNLKKCNGTF